MAVRKIPLKERSYLPGDGSVKLYPLSSNNNDTLAEDASVTLILARIRKTLLTDRALHDKVYISSFDR